MKQIFGEETIIQAKDAFSRLSERLNEIISKHKVPLIQAWGYLTDILKFSVFCSEPL